MEKTVISYILEICILLCVICVSFILCKEVGESLNSENVKMNSLSLEIIENNYDMLYPMTDNYAKNNLEGIVLNISNYNKNDINCRLLMVLEKDKDLEYNNLKIKVDEEIFSLDNRYVYEDDDFLYFDLTHREVDKNENINFAMWLDENTKDLSKYSFTYNFLVEKI